MSFRRRHGLILAGVLALAGCESSVAATAISPTLVLSTATSSTVTIATSTEPLTTPVTVSLTAATAPPATATPAPTVASVAPTTGVVTTLEPPIATLPVTAAPSAPLTSSSGHLYRAGEDCPGADLGLTTTSSSGTQIKCGTGTTDYDKWVTVVG